MQTTFPGLLGLDGTILWGQLSGIEFMIVFGVDLRGEWQQRLVKKVQRYAEEDTCC